MKALSPTCNKSKWTDVVVAVTSLANNKCLLFWVNYSKTGEISAKIPITPKIYKRRKGVKNISIKEILVDIYLL